MHPLFYNANEPFAMLYGSEAAYSAGRRSRRVWPDDDRDSREQLHEEIEVPSWDDEAFSRRSRARPVDPVWGTSLSSETAQSEYPAERRENHVIGQFGFRLSSLHKAQWRYR
ncbi:hypothetical protein MRX96_049444 [Rhipicephalus microplus]